MKKCINCDIETGQLKSLMCNACYRRMKKYGDPNIRKKATNGDRKKHKLYSIYEAMKRRCYNLNCSEYRYYGGRGISVCDRWLGIQGFDNFITDMGNRPEGKINNKTLYWLDRIDNDGNYEPNNCKWSTISEQAKNRRNENMVFVIKKKKYE